MLIHLMRRHPLLPALLLLNLGLGAALTIILTSENNPTAPALPVSAPGSPVSIQSREVKPPGHFSVISERPLFNAERRQVAIAVAPVMMAAPPPKPAPPPFPAIEVLGLAQSSKVAVAVLRLVGEGRVIMLKEGEALQGWVVAAIDADRLRFERDGEQRSFSLPKPASLNNIKIHENAATARP